MGWAGRMLPSAGSVALRNWQPQRCAYPGRYHPWIMLADWSTALALVDTTHGSCLLTGARPARLRRRAPALSDCEVITGRARGGLLLHPAERICFGVEGAS